MGGATNQESNWDRGKMSSTKGNGNRCYNKGQTINTLRSDRQVRNEMQVRVTHNQSQSGVWGGQTGSYTNIQS